LRNKYRITDVDVAENIMETNLRGS